MVSQELVGYGLFGLNAVFLLGLGYFARTTQLGSVDDYEVAGRRVRWPLISGSIVVTWTYASTILAAGESAYLFGWPAIYMYQVSGLSILLMIPFFAKIKKKIPNESSFAEYVEMRFGTRVRLLSVIGGLFIEVGIMVYLLTGLGTGVSPLFGLEYWEGVIYGGVIIIAFTVLGGLWSSLITDYFQYVILWLVLAAIMILGLRQTGGMGGLYEMIQSTGQESGTRLFTSEAFFVIAVPYIGWIVYAAIDQTLWQRMYALDSSKDVVKSFALGWLAWATIPMVTGLLGLIGIGMGLEVEGSSSNIIALVTRNVAPPVVVFLWGFTVFNAIASSMGSVLVAMSTLVTNGIAEELLDSSITGDRKLRMNYLLVVLFGVLGMGLSLLSNSVLYLGIFLAGVILSVSLPIFMSFIYPPAEKKSTFIAMAVGLLLSLTLSAAVNFGYLTEIGSLTVSVWQVYIFILIFQLVVIIVGGIISSSEPIRIEDLPVSEQTGGEMDD